MTETILLAVDDDEDRMQPVVDHAAKIAEALNSTVVLFHVYSTDTFSERLNDFELDSADPAELAKRNATIRAAASRLREEGVDLTIEASTGDPSAEIISHVESHNIDQVFLGGRNRSPAGKLVLGSVSQDVLLSVDVPCTVVSE